MNGVPDLWVEELLWNIPSGAEPRRDPACRPCDEEGREVHPDGLIDDEETEAFVVACPDPLRDEPLAVAVSAIVASCETAIPTEALALASIVAVPEFAPLCARKGGSPPMDAIPAIARHVNRRDIIRKGYLALMQVYIYERC
jgi:hypothetical protein